MTYTVSSGTLNPSIPYHLFYSMCTGPFSTELDDVAHRSIITKYTMPASDVCVCVCVCELQLVTAAEVDRESQARHVVHIGCHDNGSPAMTSRSTLSVVIDDVNDNKPSFTQQRHTGQSVQRTDVI